MYLPNKYLGTTLGSICESKCQSQSSLLSYTSPKILSQLFGISKIETHICIIIMLTRLLHSATRTATRTWNISARASPTTMKAIPQFRSMGTLEESVEASQAYKNSCYLQIDFTINEEDTVYEAVQRFSAYNVGCLVTVDTGGKCVC